MDVGDISVSKAEVADMAAIAAIYGNEVRHGFATFEEEAPDAAEMARRWQGIVGAGLPYLVARQSGRVLGYAYASAYRPRPAYRFTVETSVYVAETARGQGVGRLVLSALIAACKAGPWRQAIAVIGDSGNAASIGLHRTLGYAPRGVMRAVGFKHGRWVDTVVMQRALGDGAGTYPE